MGNHAQPEMVSRSRRRDVKESRVKLSRTWSEQQELRGDDLATIARAYRTRVRLSKESEAEEPDFLEREREECPRDESLEAWVCRTERHEEGIYALLGRVSDALNPFMAKWLTAETLDELTTMISTLLPHVGGPLRAHLQDELQQLTTWEGLGEYLGRLAYARQFEASLVEERARRLEAASRRPRVRLGSRR